MRWIPMLLFAGGETIEARTGDVGTRVEAIAQASIFHCDFVNCRDGVCVGWTWKWALGISQ